jgi:hypothetical protein
MLSVRKSDTNLLSDATLAGNLTMGGGRTVTGWAYAPSDANSTCAHRTWAKNPLEFGTTDRDIVHPSFEPRAVWLLAAL